MTESIKIGKLGKIYNGDCEVVLKQLPDNSIDSIITDPPYGLSFMNKHWDYDIPSVAIWQECLRVLKPGGTLLCFAGTRTQHRMACNIENAGFMIKDTIMWLYSSGFPKAHKIEVDNFEGYKTHGLKPAYEPIIMAVKPNEGSYAQNAIKYGVAGLNIDECRIEANGDRDMDKLECSRKPYESSDAHKHSNIGDCHMLGSEAILASHNVGRFPANIILNEEAGQLLDEQSGVTGVIKGSKSQKDWQGFNQTSNVKFNSSHKIMRTGYDDIGGASRFFYCAKASKAERNAGCDDMEDKRYLTEDSIFGCKEGGVQKLLKEGKTLEEANLIIQQRATNKNTHPTIKPIRLMEYLCKLTKTPTGGIVLDPFAGSGSTGCAAILTDRPYILIEREQEYIPIIENRLKYYDKHGI